MGLGTEAAPEELAASDSDQAQGHEVFRRLVQVLRSQGYDTVAANLRFAGYRPRGNLLLVYLDPQYKGHLIGRGGATIKQLQLHLNVRIQFADQYNQKDCKTTKKHVFLSYCHEDWKEVARLRDELIASGETVWWDQDILPGQDWRRALRRAVEDAYAVVACFSKETDKRQASGMFPELRNAIDIYRSLAPGSTFLIPVRLSTSQLPHLEIDAVRMLSNLQYIDLFPKSRRAEGLDKLVAALRAAPHHPWRKDEPSIKG
jgi:hypothetical protein